MKKIIYVLVFYIFINSNNFVLAYENNSCPKEISSCYNTNTKIGETLYPEGESCELKCPAYVNDDKFTQIIKYKLIDYVDSFIEKLSNDLNKDNEKIIIIIDKLIEKIDEKNSNYSSGNSNLEYINKLLKEKKDFYSNYNYYEDLSKIWINSKSFYDIGNDLLKKGYLKEEFDIKEGKLANPCTGENYKYFNSFENKYIKKLYNNLINKDTINSIQILEKIYLIYPLCSASNEIIFALPLNKGLLTLTTAGNGFPGRNNNYFLGFVFAENNKIISYKKNIDIFGDKFEYYQDLLYGGEYKKLNYLLEELENDIKESIMKNSFENKEAEKSYIDLIESL